MITNVVLIILLFGSITCVVDLTQIVDEAVPYYPKSKPFKKKKRSFEMGWDVGTHLDVSKNGRTVELISPYELVVKGVKIDISDKVVKNPDYTLTDRDIKSWEAKYGTIPPGSFVIVETGWWKRWADIFFYRNQDEHGKMHYPGISKSAVMFLITKRDIRGVGIDTLSVDPGLSKFGNAQKLLLSSGKLILENLGNLGELPPKGFVLLIGPMKIRGAKTVPARVIAVCRNS